MLSKKVKNNLEHITSIIINSCEYQTCLKLKQQMNENKEITKLISKVKKLQKEYIKSNYDDSIKKRLDSTLDKLNQIPIYVIYNQNLEVVNSMIFLVNDEINHYFDKKLNESVPFF